jgi:hypothetical protein
MIVGYFLTQQEPCCAERRGRRLGGSTRCSLADDEDVEVWDGDDSEDEEEDVAEESDPTAGDSWTDDFFCEFDASRSSGEETTFTVTSTTTATRRRRTRRRTYIFRRRRMAGSSRRTAATTAAGGRMMWFGFKVGVNKNEGLWWLMEA